jgi:hypothetical protein
MALPMATLSSALHYSSTPPPLCPSVVIHARGVPLLAFRAQDHLVDLEHAGAGAFPKCDIFLAHEEHHNLPPDNTVP